MSEKKKPTYDLEAFQAQCTLGLNATRTALRDAAMLGFDRPSVVRVIQTMHRVHFHESMTSHTDSKLWQDVYYVPSDTGLFYVKFTAEIITGFLLLSFKEKENGSF